MARSQKGKDIVAHAQSQKRVVLHLDMDAFFAAIEERDHPEFHEFPIVVGADPLNGTGRGVVSTASYEARKYGVHSAQPISQAWRLCKEGERTGGKACIFFGGNHKKYTLESKRIMDIMRQHGGPFEQVGVDEAYLEIDDPKKTTAQLSKIAQKIKKKIYATTQLTCSVGIGPNRLIAKIASDYQKPDGLTIVKRESVIEFLAPMPVRKLPGIGPKTEQELRRMNIETVVQLQQTPPQKLREHFGAWGEGMFMACHGIDNKPIGEYQPIKSLGRERTFAQDVYDPVLFVAALKKLSQHVSRDVADESVQFKKVEIRVRFSNFETRTRQTGLLKLAVDVKTIEKNALRLFVPFLDRRENPKNLPIRLLGVRVGGLQEKK